MELLRCRNRPAVRTARHIRQRRYSVASLDIEKIQDGQKRAQFLTSESVGAVMCSDTLRRRSSKAVKERPVSAPSRVASDEIFTQQRNKLIVTVQIENVPGGKGIQRKTELPKNTTELGRSRCHISGKIVRSSSLNENSFVSLTKCHERATQKNTQRSRSVPIILTNLNESENNRTVDELTSSEKELLWNRYLETKL